MMPSLSRLPSSPPLTSDPAVHLHSQVNSDDIIAVVNSDALTDDIEAIELQRAEATVAKNRQGIVIQHRAWRVAEAFRSEEDYIIDSPTSKRRKLDVIQENQSPNLEFFPSSPPLTAMAVISSPVAYPASSSGTITPLNGRRMDGAKPLPRLVAGFLMDEDDEEGEMEEQKDEAEERNRQESQNDHPRDAILDDQAVNVGLFKGALFGPPHQAPTQLEPQCSSPFEPRISSDEEDPPREGEPSTSWSSCGQMKSSRRSRTGYSVRTCSGKSFDINPKPSSGHTSFERMMASRTTTNPGRAATGYYGVEIHQLMDQAAKDVRATAENTQTNGLVTPPRAIKSSVACGRIPTGKKTMLWTEKYRPKRYTDLVGDERTHRSVLGWMKGWDPLVFPKPTRKKALKKPGLDESEQRPHRKILLLAGQPGLGKTTLAHVCARHAGYEVLEINASDERSRDIVKGRIRDSVGTDTVRSICKDPADGKRSKAGRPVCVVVDEVDGAHGGSGGGGDGGFINALIDLIHLDQKNASAPGIAANSAPHGKSARKRKDNFRLLRPIILVCNDVYHAALRPLRQSGLAEIIHVRKPVLSQVVPRIQDIMLKEGCASDGDAIRRLCESVWGTSSRRDATSYGGSVEGDIRGILVVAEWVAGKLRSSRSPSSAMVNGNRLTRTWVEQHVAGDLAHGGGASRSLGRGGAKEAVERVFLEGAGFRTAAAAISRDRPRTEMAGRMGVAEMGKKDAMRRLRELVESCGEVDRVVADCFAAYPTRDFRDDSILSNPDRAYEWLHFHDVMSSKVYGGQEWELAEYLSQPVLAFHHLFASSGAARASWTSNADHQPSAHQRRERGGLHHDQEAAEGLESAFSGPRAEFNAREAEKENRSILSTLLGSFSVHMARAFRSSEDVATELLPCLTKLVTPDVKPVVVGGSGDQRGTASVRTDIERNLVRRAVNVMNGVGITFQRCRVDGDMMAGRTGTWVYRMEPPLDVISAFSTSSTGSAPAPTRYAIRQVLDQEYQKDVLRRQNEAREARYKAGGAGVGTDNNNKALLAGKMDRRGDGESDDGEHDDGKDETSHDARQAGKPMGRKKLKRDFFGRIIENESSPYKSQRTPPECAAEDEDRGEGDWKKAKTATATSAVSGSSTATAATAAAATPSRVWISYHEGFSNAVRKPVRFEDFLRGL